MEKDSYFIKISLKNIMERYEDLIKRICYFEGYVNSRKYYDKQIEKYIDDINRRKHEIEKKKDSQTF